MTFNVDSHRPPAGAPEAKGGAPFRFAPTFIIDFIASSFTMALFLFLLPRADPSKAACAIVAVLGLAIALCYCGKVFVIGFLNKKGGDARDYVISSDLVTTGLYAYSRNPTYFLTLVQYILWAALLCVLAFTPFSPVAFVASLLVPLVFFVVMDRVIDREDAALSAKHPEAFAAYAKSVGRWFGRKRPVASKS